MSFNLILPKRDGTNDQETVQLTRTLVMVGANGSGKSRIGKWIEDQNSPLQPVKRISAQKVLTVPDASLKTYEDAESLYKKAKNTVTDPENHFQQLLDRLYAEERERDARMMRKLRSKRGRPADESSLIEQLKEVWQTILPHRELTFVNGKLMVAKPSGTPYPANQMSDGEKIIFYLLGHILSTPSDAIVIIDEPEIHLHKALLHELWSVLQKLRKDCLFVLITHDLEFSADISKDLLIWIREYQDTPSWKWEQIELDEDLPEELLTTVLGSRKPVLFIEGERGGWDHILYKKYYSHFLVIPRGSCNNVIQCTKGFKKYTSPHNLRVFGLIDRDLRTISEVMKLKNDGIFCTKVAIVENILCYPEIACKLATSSIDDVGISSAVCDFFEQNKDEIVVTHLSHQLGKMLKSFPIVCKDVDLQDAVSKTKILLNNVEKQKHSCEKKYDNLLAQKKAVKILGFIKHKGLQNHIAQKVGAGDSKVFQSRLLNLLSIDDEYQVLKPALDHCLPKIV